TGWWLFGTELQHPLRHAATRTRSHLSIRRRSHLRRSEVVHLPARHGPGLRGDPDAPGLRVPEPERKEVLWLRYFVLVRSQSTRHGTQVESHPAWASGQPRNLQVHMPHLVRLAARGRKTPAANSAAFQL